MFMILTHGPALLSKAIVVLYALSDALACNMRASSASLAESASCCAAVAHASSVAERVSVFKVSTLNSQYSLENSKLELLRPTMHAHTDGPPLNKHIIPMHKRKSFVKITCKRAL